MNTMKNKFYKTTSRKIGIKKATESKKEEVIDKACEDVSAFWLGKKFQQHGWNDAFEKYIAFSLREIDDVRNQEFAKVKVLEILFKEHDGQLL